MSMPTFWSLLAGLIMGTGAHEHYILCGVINDPGMMGQ